MRTEGTATRPPSTDTNGIEARAGSEAGARIEAEGLSRDAGGRRIMDEVSLVIEPGELVAVLGGSGAGKTTLLETLAGLAAPSAGGVRHDGADPAAGGAVGFVPQDDIIHTELPLRRTLAYAARLRLPAGTPEAAITRRVDEILHGLDLAERASVPVSALSGGQRKRASIAVEMLARPRVCFLDEPTSGLDPVTSVEVLRLLRALSGGGVTVVLSTHRPEDADLCDRVVLMAPGGTLAFSGSPEEAKRQFGVTDLADVYVLLDGAAGHREPTAPEASTAPTGSAAPGVPSRHRPGPIRQWWHLTRRNAEVMVRNRLTLAVLLGSPVLVTSMMAVLFEPGGFAPRGHGAAPVQIVFWLAFDGFFFGLTYGLLQIVGEFGVFRRERFAGLSVTAYLASKITMLVPLLAVVDVLLLGVLRMLDRLPPADARVYAALFGVILMEATSALALGLLVSAAVRNAAQACLALPMLCFPQVLFAGAVVPVTDMAAPGRAFGQVLANRHAFQALGSLLDLDERFAGSPDLSSYVPAFTVSAWRDLLLLAVLGVAAFLAAVWTLHRRTLPTSR
ncbi:ATP-binding cassette domain-containing protein [Actinomadura sp. K4S16]|uniref:ATP-binding cassette domain-containing protein n=1 Tax=Actinomadura sp. K4S16 TaxID=1316147 RepID=UPI0011F05766|nr:ATP-binding cassette domain-containing protein [Actinomadura sp. K4S16]